MTPIVQFRQIISLRSFSHLPAQHTQSVPLPQHVCTTEKKDTHILSHTHILSLTHTHTVTGTHIHRSAAVVSMVTAWSTSQSGDCKRGAPPKSSPKLMRIYGPDPPATQQLISPANNSQDKPHTAAVHACIMPTDTSSYYTLITF